LQNQIHVVLMPQYTGALGAALLGAQCYQ